MCLFEHECPSWDYMKINKDFPEFEFCTCFRDKWICADCGKKHGRILENHLSTWHEDLCHWCGKCKSVTEPRDFGYPPEPEEYDFSGEWTNCSKNLPDAGVLTWIYAKSEVGSDFISIAYLMNEKNIWNDYFSESVWELENVKYWKLLEIPKGPQIRKKWTS